MLTLPVVTGMFVSSCGNSKSGGDDHSADTSKVDSFAVSNLTAENNEMMYLVPAPGEMIRFVRDVSKKNNKNISFLNPIDNAKKYVVMKAKALNFGIYSCDLSYCSTFEIGTEAVKYLKVVKQFGEDIGVSSTVQPSMIKRIEANIDKPDSLEFLSNDIYLSSFETLQNGEQGVTLALVIAGGYVESLHVICNLTKYEAKSSAIDRIAEQKYTLDNIIEFSRKYESDISVAEVITQLSELKALFDQLQEKTVETAKTKTEKGKTVLGGGTIIEMTADQYKGISEKIKSIRNSFAQIN